jgi:hypothetical protein
MTRLYEYVGPAEILERTRHQEPGSLIRTLPELRAWLRAHGALGGRELTATFVLDREGALRLADRRSEHVACAGAEPVRSAGELTFTLLEEQGRVVAASNQSTGFCPEPESWSAVEAALDQLGVTHPGGFTAAFQFRRCPACGQTNLVKEGVFVCDACDAELPRAWNYGS